MAPDVSLHPQSGRHPGGAMSTWPARPLPPGICMLGTEPQHPGSPPTPRLS